MDRSTLINPSRGFNPLGWVGGGTSGYHTGKMINTEKAFKGIQPFRLGRGETSGYHTGGMINIEKTFKGITGVDVDVNVDDVVLVVNVFCVVDVETAVDFVLVVDVVMLSMSVKRRRERVDLLQSISALPCSWQVVKFDSRVCVGLSV